jgi:hypothetical protein
LPILTNLKTFYYHGMAMNANVMLSKKVKSRTVIKAYDLKKNKAGVISMLYC